MAANLTQGLDAIEVVLSPGDVLCLPAFWIHEVEVVQGPSISFNAWRVPKSAIFGKADLFLVDPESGSSIISTPLQLRSVLASVASRVLCGESRVQSNCVSAFFSRQLAQRWRPLLDFDAPTAIWTGCIGLPLSQVESPPERIIEGIVVALAAVEPASVIPLFVIDWAEAVCYSFFDSAQIGDGIRECPFFIFSCLRE